MTTHLLCPV